MYYTNRQIIKTTCSHTIIPANQIGMKTHRHKIEFLCKFHQAVVLEAVKVSFSQSHYAREVCAGLEIKILLIQAIYKSRYFMKLTLTITLW